MKKLLLAATGLAGIALASPASATLILDESINGGGFNPICSGTNACLAGLIFTDAAGVKFTILGASSNSPGTAGNADVTQASVRVENTSAATAQIVLRAGDTGFLAPSGATTLSNNISGTVITGSPLNLFSSIACANPSNAQNSCLGADQTSLISADIRPSNSSGANSNAIAIANLTTPFSLTQVSNFTLGAGTVLTYSNSADVSAAEPASLLLLGFGVLGLAYFARNRNGGGVPISELA